MPQCKSAATELNLLAIESLVVCRRAWDLSSGLHKAHLPGSHQGPAHHEKLTCHRGQVHCLARRQSAVRASLSHVVNGASFSNSYLLYRRHLSPARTQNTPVFIGRRNTSSETSTRF